MIKSEMIKSFGNCWLPMNLLIICSVNFLNKIQWNALVIEYNKHGSLNKLGSYIKTSICVNNRNIFLINNIIDLLSSVSGMSVGDFSRAIKPFSTMSSRPLGFSMLQGTHPVGAVIQGAHKPIAITTPQPHNSSTDTKSQSVSNSTVSVTDANQSVQSTSNQGIAVNQPNYSSGHHTQVNRTLNSGKLSGSDIKKHSVDSLKEHGGHVERYMIHPTDGLNHHITNMLPTSTHSLAGFSCNQCSKTFKTKAALKLHTTVHKTSEERQYGCTICNRRFLHRHHLVVHQRKHSGEKPFKCNACAKTFMAIFLLHKHLRKHARETGPVSQISMDQLKQLHDKKLISVGSESLPFLKSGPEKEEVPVIILDDDDERVNATVEIKINDVGKFDRDGENKDKKILEIIGNNPKMILDKLKADLITKSKTKEVASNQNSTDESARKVMTENSDKIKTETEILQTNPEKTKGEDDCDVKVEYDSSNNYNYILKDSEDEGKEIGSKEDLNIDCNQVSKTENAETDDSFPQKCEETVKSNPVPEYGSDDEVELDCITGEITVVGKKRPTHEMNAIKANECREKDTELKIMSGQSDGTDETVKEVIECLVKHAENVSDDAKLAENADDKITKLKGSHGDDLMKNEQIEKTIEVIPNENDQSEVCIEENVSNVKIDVTDEHMDTDDSSTHVCTDMIDDPNTKVNVESEISVNNASSKSEAKEISLEEKECVALETENMTAGSKFDGRNIFDKITAMKDLKDVKSCHAEKEYVEKEVDIILRNIKRVVCKDDEISVVEAKKPKLETENVHIEKASKLKSEKDTKSKSDETVIHSYVGDHPKYTKGKKKGRKVKCEVCSRSFHSNHYLLLHMAVHKRNPMLQSLKKAKDYQMKAMGFVNKSNVSCEVCKKVFKFQKSLNSHMRVHSEKLIQTKLYRKAFRDFMAEAAPQNSRICDKDKSLNMSVSETESQTRHCSEDDQESSSVATSISASEKSSLDNAAVGELNEEPEDEPPIKVIVGSDNLKRYLCHACDNTYTTKQKLRMHALIHKDNCFLCEICGKSFFRQITLEKHISTHMLPRPHMCDVCKKTFIHRSSLMRHKVVHEKTAAPGLKQQVADRNFEMKMLDTYSMLKQERLQKLKMQKEQEQPERMTMKMPNKYDALDLTVKVKTEDPGLPPVLSPVITCLPSSSHSMPWNLSPPLITQEAVNGRLSNDRTPEKTDSRRISESNSGDYEQANVIERVKSRTDSTCSESDTVTVEGHKVVQKRVRKTRVYPTSCRVCKEVFPNVMLLKSHMAIHNTVETHLYECHICRHRFTQSCSLLRHLKTSCQENKMKCIPCGRTFHRRNTFEQHMRLHQGGPPNLDGSFYDKRPDEVAVHEERESDIENNNLSKVQQTTAVLKSNIAPLTIENVSLLNKNEPIIMGDQDNGDDSDDARTYLYSEGEVHSRYNSDFSDNEWSPPHSPKKIVAPQDLSMSSANMTLNLLSAVCSDIRNAEKEKELKQKEFEEKQKELETIEILANLKRGAMQKSFQHASQIVDPAINPRTVPLSIHESNLHSMSHNSNSHHFGTNIANISSNLSANNVTCISSDSIKYSVPSSGIGLIASSALASPLPNNQQKQSIAYSGLHHKKVPSVLEGNASSGSDPKIPTVVLEVAADAEHRRRAQAHRTWTGRSASVPTSREPNKSKDGSVTPDIPQMKFHYPAIHERLSLLMKAQISASTPLASENTKSAQSSPSVSLPSLSIATFIPQISPGRHLSSQTQSPMNVDTPQDLSLKRKSPVVTTVSSSNPSKTSVHSLLEPTMISPISSKISEKSPKSSAKEKQKSDIPRSIGSRSLPSDLAKLGQDDTKKAESSSAPPPLVPMFHCELCSRVLYSKTDLHLHMMEHGRSAGALYKMLHNNQVLSGKKSSSQESPVGEYIKLLLLPHCIVS